MEGGMEVKPKNDPKIILLGSKKNAIGGRDYVRKVATMFAESRHRSRTRTSERKRERERIERNNQENRESASKILKILSQVANTFPKSQASSRGREVGRERDKRI